MNHGHLFLFVASLVIGMTVCGVLLAQAPPTAGPGQPSPGGGSTMYGTLVSIDTGSLKVRTDDGVTSTFMVDERSTLPTVMTTGDRVGVEYQVLAGGGDRASRLTVLETDRQPAVAGAAAMEPDQGAAAATDEQLPTTASPLPLLALIGGLSIVTAVGLSLLPTR